MPPNSGLALQRIADWLRLLTKVEAERLNIEITLSSEVPPHIRQRASGLVDSILNPKE